MKTQLILTTLLFGAVLALAQTPGQVRGHKRTYSGGVTQDWIEVWSSNLPALAGRTNATGVARNWSPVYLQTSSPRWVWVKAPEKTAYPTITPLTWTNVVNRAHPGWLLQSNLNVLVTGYGGSGTNSQAANLAFLDAAFRNTNAAGKVSVLMDSLKVERIYRWLDRMNYTPTTNPPVARVPVRQK